jgi:hypothetical protein
MPPDPSMAVLQDRRGPLFSSYAHLAAVIACIP